MTTQMLNEEERMLQRLVRDFADRELAPRAQEVDEKEEFSWENWEGLGQLGLTGIGIDSKYGGSGGGYRQTVIAASETAASAIHVSLHRCILTRCIAAS